MSYLPHVANLLNTDKLSRLKVAYGDVNEIKKLQRHWESHSLQHKKTLGVAGVQWADKKESRNSTQPQETLVFISYQVETSLALRQTAHGLNVFVWRNEADSEGAAWHMGLI